MNAEIVGQGELSQTIATLVKAAGVDGRGVELWCVPVSELRQAVRDRLPGPQHRILLATRGLEPGTALRPSQVIMEESACLRVAALAGPVLPAEIARKSPCAAVVASPHAELRALGAAVLRSPLCRVYESADLAGVELAGALVDVFAVALGAARGLGLGAGAEALLVARAAVEGARLAGKIGGDPRTFSGLAGVGDLVACAASADHPGHRRGLALARGEASPEVVAMCTPLLRHGGNLPIVGGVKAVAAGEVRGAEMLAKLMSSAHAGEWDDA
ncbi:MAG: hypothetical protein FJ102_07460 [Deltaproteobacteria bacterium]|nr:hypothetical protein [Deltaproteobacteria bacterium]